MDKNKQPQRTIQVSAKCSDLCWMALDTDGKRVGEMDGYVPDWFPNPTSEHYGDYVSLQIDLETGQILNWKKPTQAQLKATFKTSNPLEK
jgi:hypothetical protein